MIVDITKDTYGQIKNPQFASYAAIYLDIYDDFMNQVCATGIEIDPIDYQEESEEKRERLHQKGAIFRNGGRSIYVNRISPACVACRKGVGSVTFFISLQCHRDCYYCFNPNQVDYDYFNQHERDLIQELQQIESARLKVNHLALTGGEPLLHKEKAVNFVSYADRQLPQAYKRLYTSGDHVNEDLLQDLQRAGLEEIRFSIRMHDLARGHWHTIDRIALAKEYIPHVMVEMPILPGTLATMKEILLELERLQIDSINLLEFCYPLNNAEAFNQRSFKVKKRPFHTLYNYWYAGGVPVSRSELVCLDLMEFALDRALTIGVHYCSLENKLTGQNYQQNFSQPIPNTVTFSQRDYLLKTAKVFGKDIPKVLNVFRKNGYRHYQRNEQHNYLEFHVNQIAALAEAKLDVEVGISSAIFEARPDGRYLRELKVDLTYPHAFDLAHDV